MNSIHSEVVRLKHLVDELLELRRLETGRINLKMSKFDLAKLAEDVASKMRTVLSKGNQKAIDIQVKTNKPEITVHADENCIRQILINLIDNAIKAIKQNNNCF